ncbi:MAG TPA: glycoside hydrolase family 2 TIM barrel-domain containing protein, partial [Pontiella sp.]|nr:glycoside hydrolase family 2 TIM barrel-domain containing protein [Pontiella sp.]
EVTDLLRKEGNSVVVKVDNIRRREGIPTVNSDWWNYGGITRDVTLVEVPSTFIADYAVHLKSGTGGRIDGSVQLNGAKPEDEVEIRIPELGVGRTVQTDAAGAARFTLNAEGLERWSPQNPKLYDVVFSTATDRVTEKIGFRTIETRGHDILLNGESVFLRGICIHEENALRGGRAYSKEDALMLLSAAKELGCNYVRLAHYPHSENMARLADEMGLLVWEENPVYWTIMWDNPDTYANAENQLTDMIRRDKNRASVIIWSMANETPPGDARNGFLQKLAARARSLDSTRLISAALEVHGDKSDGKTLVVEDFFADYVDIINFNQYNGWYVGTPESCDTIQWRIPYDKPVMISEFGGGALQGFHGDAQTRWTEEYQENLYEHTLPMLDRIPQFRGVSPWILYDFRSPRRVLPDIQDGWNRKGVISENGVKKKAYFVLQDFYRKKAEQQQ